MYVSGKLFGQTYPIRVIGPKSVSYLLRSVACVLIISSGHWNWGLWQRKCRLHAKTGAALHFLGPVEGCEVS